MRNAHTHDEAAFWHFLTIERVRFERSGRPFLLLLAALEDVRGLSSSLDRHLAAAVFSVLHLCLRDTDLIGWFREDRVAGAVMTEIEGRPLAEVSRLVGQRLQRALGDHLRRDVVRRLGVHLYIGEAASVEWAICDGDDVGLGADRQVAAPARTPLIFHPESHGLPRPIR